MNNPPRASLWLDVPDDCHMTAEFTGDGDIQVVLGAQAAEQQNLLFEPLALQRFVELATRMLTLPEPDDPKTDRPRLVHRQRDELIVPIFTMA